MASLKRKYCIAFKLNRLFNTFSGNYSKKQFSNRNIKNWNILSNQRQFLNSIAAKYEIKTPKDWGKLTLNDLEKSGCSGILKKHGNSIIKMLSSAFPENHWEPECFLTKPRRYWKDPNNARKFLDSLAQKWNIRKPSDWGKIRIRQIIHERGESLLQVHKSSLFETLKATYDEIQWRKEWFPTIPRYSHHFWSNEENQRLFLKQVALYYNVNEPKDWNRISLTLIRGEGGQGLLNRYNNSLFDALHSLYPQNYQRESKLFNSSFPQKHVVRLLK